MSRQSVAGSAFALARVKIFHGIAPDRLELLARECAWYRYPKGAEIIAQQDPGCEVHFIASGAVRVLTCSAAGRQVSFRDLQSGAYFGDIAAVDSGPRTTTVIALTECLLAVLPAAAFVRLLHEQPVVHERYLRNLVGLVRSLTARVTELSTLTVPHRVHAELLRLVRRSGAVGNVVAIDPVPTHVEIADHVSTSREQVTRELSALLRRGLLQKKGKALVVTDVLGLQRLVDETAPGRQQGQDASLSADGTAAHAQFSTTRGLGRPR